MKRALHLLMSLVLVLTLATTTVVAQDNINLKDQIKRELNTSDEIAKRLSFIAEDYQQQKQMIMETFRSNPQERNERLRELNTATNDTVRQMVNDRQFTQFMRLLIRQ